MTKRKKEKDVRIRVRRPWIAYPGSTIQQNHGESRDHGYLLWDIENRDDFDVKFRHLPNPCPYVTVEWEGDIEAVLAQVRSFGQAARVRVRCDEPMTHGDTVALATRLKKETGAREVTFKNDRVAVHKLIDTGSAKLVKTDLRNPEVLQKLMHDFYDDVYGDLVITEAEWAGISEHLKKYLNDPNIKDASFGQTWSLRHLKWDNLFLYGKGNAINFDNLTGIVGVFGPNRSGKSSIVGIIMYVIHNTTDRGNVKNMHVVNVRKSHGYGRAIIDVGGTDYVLERQTVKHENRKGDAHAVTSLNLFGIGPDGTASDLADEIRTDTEKRIRKLVGTKENFLMTSVAAQGETNMFVKSGATKRRQILMRFLGIDVLQQIHDLSKIDVNALKGVLAKLPDREWDVLMRRKEKEITELETMIDDVGIDLRAAQARLTKARTEFSEHTGDSPVTESQVNDQRSRVVELTSNLNEAREVLATLDKERKELETKVEKIDTITKTYDIERLRERLVEYRRLEAEVDSLTALHRSTIDELNRHERAAKILGTVPCGDRFPSCRFIKDAHEARSAIEAQKRKVSAAENEVALASAKLAGLAKDDIKSQIDKVEDLLALRSRLRDRISDSQIERVKAENEEADLIELLEEARIRFNELESAVKQDENEELAALKSEIERLEEETIELDERKLSMATRLGTATAEMARLADERKRRTDTLQEMRLHELIRDAFSKKGIPSVLTSVQLPIINAELASILGGIVNFTVELEREEDGDQIGIYINYGDSRRPLDMGSGMELIVSSIALRVALVNISSLSKSDMFIIDEGFGALDDAGVEAVGRLLESLKRYFRTILVITHVDGIKDVADHILEITKNERDASLVYD